MRRVVFKILMIAQMLLLFVAAIFMYGVREVVPPILTDHATSLIFLILCAVLGYVGWSGRRMGLYAYTGLMIVLTVLQPVPTYMLLGVLALVSIIVAPKLKHGNAS